MFSADHLTNVDRLGKDPGLVFGLELVQEDSEQNAERRELHLQEGFLQFDLKQTHFKGKWWAELVLWLAKSFDGSSSPLPSLASPSCGSAPAAAGPFPGRVGGGATPSAAPSTTCFPPRSASVNKNDIFKRLGENHHKLTTGKCLANKPAVRSFGTAGWSGGVWWAASRFWTVFSASSSSKPAPRRPFSSVWTLGLGWFVT